MIQRGLVPEVKDSFPGFRPGRLRLFLCPAEQKQRQDQESRLLYSQLLFVVSDLNGKQLGVLAGDIGRCGAS